MNDLANSWKVGIAFIVLVALRFLLTSPSAFLANARTLVLGGLTGTPAGVPETPALPADEGSVPTGLGYEHPSTEAVEDIAAAGAGDEHHSTEAVEEERSPAEDLRRSILEFVDSGIIALVLVFMIIRPFVVQAFYIPSGSMRPTLLENDKILVNKFVYRFRDPHRGDVVVFKAPPQATPDEKDFIKRLIGLPGDTVEVRDGRVYINDEPLNQDYVTDGGEDAVYEHIRADGPESPDVKHRIQDPPHYSMPPTKIQPGRVFVMGDNRNDSNDSHQWGWRDTEQLEESRIRGKAEVIFWPPLRIGLIH